MAFNFNGNIPKKIIYNNNNVAKLKYNNVIVWKGLPNTYQEVEYIQSNGTQYIDTGVIPNENTKVVAKLFTTETGNKNWFGGEMSTTQPRNGFVLNSYSESQIEYIFGNSNWTKANCNVVNKIFNLEFSKDAITVDNQLIATPSYTEFTTYTSSILIFTRQGGLQTGRIAGRIYNFAIYNNSLLIRNLIPCYRKSDNEVGLYDINNSGKNIFDKNSVTYFQAWISELNKWNYSADSKSFRVPVEPNKTYTISASNPSETIFRAGWTSSENIPTSASQVNLNDCYRYTNTNTPITMTTGAEAKYIVIQLSSANINTTIQTLQIEEGSSATTYEPYPFYTNAGTGEFTVGPDIN